MTQGEEEMSDYQKFRLKRLCNRNQDDNLSAHFSNISANMSIYTKSQRDINIKSFRSNNQNNQEEDYFFLKKQLNDKDQKYQILQKKYQDLQSKYEELLRNYKNKCQQSDKYKKMYQQEINRQRQTKLKLKNWVKQAKINLNN